MEAHVKLIMELAHVLIHSTVVTALANFVCHRAQMLVLLLAILLLEHVLVSLDIGELNVKTRTVLFLA
jgi:hypothetical protein